MPNPPITRTITVTVTALEQDFAVHPGSEDFTDDLIRVLTAASSVTLDDIVATKRYRLHVGMTGMRFLRADHRVWQADGDGWNSWGDDPLVDGNDAVTAHVMWRESVTAADADRIVRQAADYLRPASTDRDPGLIAVLSDWDTWSEDQDVCWMVDAAGTLTRQTTV